MHATMTKTYFGAFNTGLLVSVKKCHKQEQQQKQTLQTILAVCCLINTMACGSIKHYLKIPYRLKQPHLNISEILWKG